jgi:hypothetical protein
MCETHRVIPRKGEKKRGVGRLSDVTSSNSAIPPDYDDAVNFKNICDDHREYLKSFEPHTEDFWIGFR